MTLKEKTFICARNSTALSVDGRRWGVEVVML